MSKSISLAQQLAQLDQPAPFDFDPEEAGILNIEPDELNEQNDAREHYLDVGPSALRSTLHESLAGPKYEGVPISRGQLEDEVDHLSDELLSDAELPHATSEEDGENSEEEEPSDKESPPERPTDALAQTKSAPQGSDVHDLSSTLKRAREEERKKGRAVARQLAMYDCLLDARIRLQKCVTSMNKLPDATKVPIYLIDPQCREAANILLFESLSLTDDLFDLQEKLMTASEGLALPARKRRKMGNNLEVDCDWEEKVQESSVYYAELEASFHPHLLTTLQKWSNKVLAIAPSALLPSNRTKFSSKNANQVKSAVQLVDEALLEHDRLVARTQVWRGTGKRLDSDSDPPSKPADDSSAIVVEDIFDDTDLYQSLLRDIIDFRAGGNGEGLDGLSADWRASQQERKKARKATVDTRASKGRKLRFEVHDKLQNFMAPAPPPGGVAWHEEQIDELFASLLGRGFPETENVNNGVQASMDVDIKEVLKEGFRVFG